ncbi:MAG: type III pantothenate kinase [Sphaerochaetaceae bacterium]|nr:type III pantothenate kinase [Sphaerochaetaceae bacterium]
MRFLVTDVGNTNVTIALHDGNKWCDQDRVKTKDKNCITIYKRIISKYDYDVAVISSVVPNLTGSVVKANEGRAKDKTILINNNLNTGLKNIPEELGSDILCNLVAAHAIYPDHYVTVADFGTAFTTETISPDGEVLGVTIGPGMMTSVKALVQNTAQLPDLRLDLPETVLGRTSVESIKAGVIFGFTGQVEVITRQIEKELGKEVKLIVTGGFSRYIQAYINREFRADIYHTIEGARLIGLMNL